LTRGATAARTLFGTDSSIAEGAFDAELRRTTEAQSAASDPLRCVWVSANAGTGKTHVLTQRVLRLMLTGTAPEKILCLTYTKAAAAEMSKRLFDTLATWVTLEPQKLANALLTLTGEAATAPLVARARTLFTSAIETPGGLKVQTIHGFCERLLQRFPLEAEVPPSFSILDDDITQKLVREAIDSVLSDAATKPDSDIGRALTTAVAYISDTQFDEVLKVALGHRSWIEDAARWPADVGGTQSGFAGVEAAFRKAFDIPTNSTVAQTLGAIP
jgi:ATP-dependent helicase/nuclease subunit A